MVVILLPTKSCLANVVFNRLGKGGEALADITPSPEWSIMYGQRAKKK